VNADTADVVLLDDYSAITPTQLTANTNDYNPANGLFTSVWRISSNGAINLTGIQAGTSGQRITLCNVGTQTITLKNQSASSVAANRFTNSGGDVTLSANGVKFLVYDTTVPTWFIA